MRLAEHLGLRIDVLRRRPGDDVVRVVVDGHVVRSDGIQQLDVVLGRDPVFDTDDDVVLLRVARHLLHHGHEGVHLRLIRHVDVAVAQDRKQDVVRAEVARDFHGFDEQDWRRPGSCAAAAAICRENRWPASKSGCRSRAPRAGRRPASWDPAASVLSRRSGIAGSPECRRGRSSGRAQSWRCRRAARGSSLSSRP